MNNQVFDAVRDVAKTLDVLVDFMKCLEIDPGEILWHLGDKPCWSSDLVEYLALKENKPVRELYVELATALQVARDEDRSLLVSFFEKRGVSGEKLLDPHRQKPLERKLGELLEKSKSVY
jgi:argininosuccinate lyase